MGYRLEDLLSAIDSLEALLNKDLSNLDDVLIDGVHNGCVQKFEYCIELCWKTIKSYLNKIEGKDVSAPKPVIKAFYLSNHINEDSYLALLDMIEDRNRLSHIYNKDDFDAVYKKLPQHLLILKSASSKLAELIN